MSSETARVTVVGPRGRLDVTVPTSVPVGALLPDLLALAGPPADGSPHQWCVGISVGGDLDPERSLGDMGLHDGTVLMLRREEAAIARPTVNEVAQAVADDLEEAAVPWEQRSTTRAAAAVTAGAAILAFVLSPRGTGVAVALAVAGVLAIGMTRLLARRDEVSAGLLTAAASVLSAAAGGAGASTVDDPYVVVGIMATAALLSAAIAIALGGGATAVAITTGSAGIAAGAGAASVVGGADAAALTLMAGALGLGVLPGVAARLAGLRVSDAAAAESIALTAAEEARRISVALYLGIAAAMGAAALVLGATGSAYGVALAVAACAATLLRVQDHRFAREITAIVIAAAAVGLGLLLSEGRARDLASRDVALWATLAVAGAGLLVAYAGGRATIPGPAVRVWLRRLEGLALTLCIPLAMGELGVYTSVRRFVADLW